MWEKEPPCAIIGLTLKLLMASRGKSLLGVTKKVVFVPGDQAVHNLVLFTPALRQVRDSGVEQNAFTVRQKETLKIELLDCFE